VEYCLDTSVYTQAHREYYAFDLAPGFWKSLRSNAELKVLTSPMAVYSEIEDGKDELEKWVRDNKNILFTDPDDKLIESFRQIVEFINERYEAEHWIRQFLAGADPWVIAHAKAHSLIVVAMEGRKGSEEQNNKTHRFIGKIKIPNVCDHFGVKCISTYEMVRALKIGLG
jgi:hypothetical protein